MVNQDPFETNLKVLVQHAHELPTGHFHSRQYNDSTGKPATAHSSRSSVLEADRLRRGLRLERLHLGRADRGRDAVRERLVDRREHRDCATGLVSITNLKKRRGRGKERRTLACLDLGALRVLEVHGDVVHEVLAVRVAEDLLVQRARLLEVDCEER